MIKNVSEILEASDIVALVGEYVSLRKSGNNYQGLCPFHTENTPSFFVNPLRNSYKCFGCGKGGSLAGFIMEHENMTYPQALELLAKKAHINIDKEQLSKEEEDKRNHEESIRQSMMIIYRAAEEWYIEQRSAFQSIIGDYITARLGNNGAADNWGIGYAPRHWTGLWNYLIENQYREDLLAQSGLFWQNNKGEYMDFFRDRLIIPVADPYGNTIAFTGRLHPAFDNSYFEDKGKKAPKYINSPDTSVFSKRNTLYGFNLAKKSIKKEDCVHIVEGNFDCISMHRSGITNTVALMGKELSQEQILLLKRFTTKVNLIPDNDGSGEGLKAMLRAGRTLMQSGFRISITPIKEVKDVDEMVRG